LANKLQKRDKSGRFTADTETAADKSAWTGKGAGTVVQRSSDDLIENMGGRNMIAAVEYLFDTGGKSWDDLELVRTDPKYLSALRRRKAPVKKAPLEIEPYSQDERDLERKALVERAFSNLPQRTVREQLLEGISDGFSVGELMWNVTADGKLLPSEIIVHPAKWFYWGEDRKLYFSPDDQATQELPERKFVVFRHMPTSRRPYGVKLLAACYWYMYLKKHAWKFQAIFIEKFGMPAISLAFPSGRDSAEEQTKLDDVLKAWASDLAIKVPDDVKVELIEAAAKGGTPYEAMIRACDNVIAYTVQGGTLTTEAESATGRGTQALGSIHADSLEELVEDDAAQIEEIYNEIAKWIIELNEGEAEGYPSCSLRLKDQGVDTAWNENARKWHEKGVKIPVDQVYSKSQIDPPEEDEEIIPPPAGANPPPVGSPDNTPGDKPQFSFADERQAAGYVDASAMAAEAQSMRSLDEWERAIIDDGVDEVVKLTRAYERIFDAAAVSGDNDPIDGINDSDKFERALTAVNRRQARILKARALGDKRTLSQAQLARLQKSITNTTSVSDAQARTLSNLPALQPALAEPITQARLFARLLGREHMAIEVNAQAGSDFSKFTPGCKFAELPDPESWKVQPVEAIRSVRARRAVTPDEWERMSAEERKFAFTYASAPDEALAELARTEIERAVSEGASFEEFRQTMQREYKSRGLEPLSDHYAQTIFRTNVMSAYQDGRAEMFDRPEVRAVIPYLEYHTAGDMDVRPEHAALAGIYAADDPFWSTHKPPIGHNCRCGMRPCSQMRLDERGLDVRTGSDALADLPEPYANKIKSAQSLGFGRWQRRSA